MTFPFENIDDFFDTADFAVSASYCNWNGSSFDTAASITVQAKTAAHVVDPYSGERVLNEAACLAKTSEVPNAKPDDKITFGGVNYKVHEAVEDGSGFTQMTLLVIDT